MLVVVLSTRDFTVITGDGGDEACCARFGVSSPGSEPCAESITSVESRTSAESTTSAESITSFITSSPWNPSRRTARFVRADVRGWSVESVVDCSLSWAECLSCLRRLHCRPRAGEYAMGGPRLTLAGLAVSNWRIRYVSVRRWKEVRPYKCHKCLDLQEEKVVRHIYPFHFGRLGLDSCVAHVVVPR
jgi:hypothetical protein